MSPLPYLPGGVNELPANRFLLYANGSHEIHYIDEAALTFEGASFTGIWESGSLSGDGIKEKTISRVTLVYNSSVITTGTIKVSGDGGATWAETKVFDIAATSLDRVQISFNTSGFDIRVRIELDTDAIFNLYEIHPVLIVRGEHDV